MLLYSVLLNAFQGAPLSDMTSICHIGYFLFYKLNNMLILWSLLTLLILKSRLICQPTPASQRFHYPPPNPMENHHCTCKSKPLLARGSPSLLRLCTIKIKSFCFSFPVPPGKVPTGFGPKPNGFSFSSCMTALALVLLACLLGFGSSTPSRVQRTQMCCVKEERIDRYSYIIYWVNPLQP